MAINKTLQASSRPTFGAIIFVLFFFFLCGVEEIVASSYDNLPPPPNYPPPPPPPQQQPWYPDHENVNEDDDSNLHNHNHNVDNNNSNNNNMYNPRSSTPDYHQDRWPPPVRPADSDPFAADRPAAFTTRTPIHYNFRSKDDNLEGRFDSDDDDVDNSNDNKPAFASARRDPVTRFQSDLRGRLLLWMSAIATGSFLSAFGLQGWWTPGAVAFGLGYFIRGVVGDCVRSLALALLWTIQRSRRVWKVYPTWPHIKATLRAAPRRPFPPARNPWNYQAPPGRPVFNMMFATIAMTLVGSTVGGNVPLLPKWMGGLAGAAAFALLVTQGSAAGDLARTAGMRVVGLLRELWKVAVELRLRQHLTRLLVRILDKLLFLDRQHKIRDKVAAAVSVVYRRVAEARGNKNNRDEDEDRPPRRRRRRDDDDDDGDRPPRRRGDYDDDERPRRRDDERPRRRDDGFSRPRVSLEDRRRPPMDRQREGRDDDDRRPDERRDPDDDRRQDDKPPKKSGMFGFFR